MTALDDAAPDVAASDAAQEPSFEDLAARVDQLRDRVRHSAEQTLLEETLEAVTDFNRAGLVELVQVLRADPRGEELLFSAVDRPEVMALLVAHGIVRVDRTMEVLRVVDQLRPYLAASSVQLDVARVDGDTAYVSFGTGCQAPTPAQRAEILGALSARMPSGIVVVEEQASSGGAFVPLTSLRVGPPA